MARAYLESLFPMLKGLAYRLSPKTRRFNCLAYALGDTKNWWEPSLESKKDSTGSNQRYWPSGFPVDDSVETVELILRDRGYTVEIELSAIPEKEAIAIFATDGVWTHFAKYKDGVWSSKLGKGNDIVGVPVLAFEGYKEYGRLVKILGKP
jgi:hypothetical protein